MMVAKSNDLATTLDQCLSQVESGKARIRSCLLAYPSQAEELEPLLFAAEVLRTGPRPELSPESETRIATLVFGRAFAAPRPERRAERHVGSRWNLSWAFAALSALLFVAVLSSSSLAHAATGALPGSALYSAKLATETAWLWLAPAREEAALHLRFAERRLAETEALVVQEGVIEPKVLETMARHVDNALQSAQALPEERGIPVLQAVVELSSKQEQTLSGLMGRVQTEARGDLEQAVLVCRQQGLQARGAVDARQSPLPGEEGLGSPADENRPPDKEGTGPAQQAPFEEQQGPPAQQQEPPGQQKPGRDSDDGASKDGKEDKDEAGDEEKEAEEEEKEAQEEEEEKEAEEEEKEAEEEEEEKEAEEEEKEEKKEEKEDEKEDEKEEKEEEKEEKEDEKEDEKEEKEEEKEEDEDEDKDKD
jgi:hypothetical protein